MNTLNRRLAVMIVTAVVLTPFAGRSAESSTESANPSAGAVSLAPLAPRTQDTAGGTTSGNQAGVKEQDSTADGDSLQPIDSDDAVEFAPRKGYAPEETDEPAGPSETQAPEKAESAVPRTGQKAAPDGASNYYSEQGKAPATKAPTGTTREDTARTPPEEDNGEMTLEGTITSKGVKSDNTMKLVIKVEDGYEVEAHVPPVRGMSIPAQGTKIRVRGTVQDGSDDLPVIKVREIQRLDGKDTRKGTRSPSRRGTPVRRSAPRYRSSLIQETPAGTTAEPARWT